MFKRKPPVIDTDWGPVTEGYRLQAALNMWHDPVLRAQIITMIGEREARRRYPEGFPTLYDRLFRGAK